MSLDSVQINVIKELRGNGFNQQEIADHLRVSRKTVESHLKKLRENYKYPTPEELLIESIIELGKVFLKGTLLKTRKQRRLL